MPYCEVSPGVRLYCEDFGEGEAIVFISGGHLTHKVWESQVAALAGEFRTVTFDWRGTGHSDKPRGGYSIDQAAQDVCGLMDGLGIAKALLVGHGLGAHLAILAAEARPHAVKGLFLTAAAPWVVGERDGQVGGLPEDFVRFVTTQEGRASVPYAETCFELGDKWMFHKAQNPGVYQWVLQQALEWPQYVLQSYAGGLNRIDHRERLPRIACPTVIAQGRHDRKQRYEGAIYLANAMPNARLVTFENSAHMPAIEEVDAFNAALLGFARVVMPARKVA
jgi:pimeloyl-ACP methyl ester carboxylesterase